MLVNIQNNINIFRIRYHLKPNVKHNLCNVFDCIIFQADRLPDNMRLRRYLLDFYNCVKLQRIKFVSFRLK